MKRRFVTAAACVAVWGTSGAWAQPRPQRDLTLESAHSKRLALVIGNDAYARAPLQNPVNDAKTMKRVLSGLGFQVDLAVNADFKAMTKAIDRFVGNLAPGDVGLFYYAGHGVQLGGENYLVPVDFNAKDEADAKFAAYSAERVRERMEGSGARLNLIVLDACRNNPFKATRSQSGGLAAMSFGRGTFIAFATAPGKTASDNPKGNNGLFTAYLAEALDQPGMSLDKVFNMVRERVFQASEREQLPWTGSSVIGEFYFKDGAGQAETKAATPAQTGQAETHTAETHTAEAKRDAAEERPRGPEERELRERMGYLAARANALRASLQKLEQEQNRSGQAMRQDISAAWKSMEYFMDEAAKCLSSNDPDASRNMDLAEREVEKLEKFFGH